MKRLVAQILTAQEVQASSKHHFPGEKSKKWQDEEFEDTSDRYKHHDVRNGLKFLNQEQANQELAEEDFDDYETSNKEIVAANRSRGRDNLRLMNKQSVYDEYDADNQDELLAEDFEPDVEPNMEDQLKQDAKDAERKSIMEQKYSTEKDEEEDNQFYQAAMSSETPVYPHLDDDMPEEKPQAQSKYITDHEKHFKPVLEGTNTKFWLTSDDVNALADKITDPKFQEDLRIYEEEYNGDGVEKEQWDELYKNGILDLSWDEASYSFQELQNELEQRHEALDNEQWEKKHNKEVSQGKNEREHRKEQDKGKPKTHKYLR